MSAPTHTPATPLPWKVGERNDHANIYTLKDNLRAHAQANLKFEDAAYIAHACNAYPKLVEALRVEVGKCKGERVRKQRNCVEYEYASEHGVCCGALRALLRSLGEAS